MKRLLAMIQARLLEVARDRAAWTWNFLVAPLLVVIAAMFSSGPQAVFKVGVLGDLPLTPATHPFFATEGTRFHRETDREKAIAEVQHQRIDLLLDPTTKPLSYWINTESDKGRLLQRLLRGEDAGVRAEQVTGTQIRYGDWLVPGLLGANIMFTGLFGIGHVLVRYRKSGYLKRLNGTPLRAIEFVSAQLIACLIVVVSRAALVYVICNLVLHMRMEGSYLNLLLVAVMGSMSMIAMSLLVTARISNEELSAGLLNLLSWPMLLLSGVFFSLDGAPALIQGAAGFLPLTQMLEAARAVMLDGAHLIDIARPLLVMAAMTGVFLAVGSSLFRWTQD
jgi:ABC-2 type transport system permease protein